MKVFLQDYYLNSGLVWSSFIDGVLNEDLNLSLYFNKFINKSALLDSPNTAKLFSMKILNDPKSFEQTLTDLLNKLNELRELIEAHAQDNKRTKLKKDDTIKKLEELLNLLLNGDFFDIETDQIKNYVRGLYYPDFNRIKNQLNSLLFSINDLLKKIRTYDVFKINLSIKQYEQFFRLQESLWKGVDAKTFKMKTRSRLVIGLGDESVYETSIKLHRNYGVPFIPGSALKGVAKHYSILRLTDHLINEFELDFFKLAKKVQDALENPATDENDERAVEKAVMNKLKVDTLSNEILDEFKLLRKIFGTQKYEGGIIFFDAFPTVECLKKRAENGKPILELDVMNPHYSPYYSASEGELQGSIEKAPGDWHSPVPIFFLTVPRGVEFQFAIALRANIPELLDKTKERTRLLDKAKELLLSALKEFGVGAKTTLGYGRLE